MPQRRSTVWVRKFRSMLPRRPIPQEDRLQEQGRIHPLNHPVQKIPHRQGREAAGLFQEEAQEFHQAVGREKAATDPGRELHRAEAREHRQEAKAAQAFQA